MIEVDAKRQEVLDADGHLLILGGPGCGKTTLALLKADREVAGGRVRDYQRILFLSFARATVARVMERASEIVSAAAIQSLEISTYHGFCWSLLRSHAYLLNGRRPLRLLPPPECDARLAELADGAERSAELHRIFRDEGVLGFDLFAELAGDLLLKSQSLRRILSATYPTIVLDEFQDTDSAEWRLIQALGQGSRLISLADADQRIYQFRGASPARIDEFIREYQPRIFDFGLENNRSAGTDIVAFGNDVLAGQNKGRSYSDVACVGYQVRKKPNAHADAKVHVLQALRRLSNRSGDWSLAVLVPTNQLMLEVSEYLGLEQRFRTGTVLGAISHDVAFDPAGPALAASVIASALEPGGVDEINARLLLALRDHLRGRGPTAQAMKVSAFIDRHHAGSAARGPAQRLLISEGRRLASAIAERPYSGNVEEDWIFVRKLFVESLSPPIVAVGSDAKYLRLLHKGSLLRSRLAERWRESGTYRGATRAVKDALLQEHFSAGTRRWKGVHVMTIHKAKGKEFDEVVIYEGAFQHRFVRRQTPDGIAESRRNLRVAVTRARTRATVLTPGRDRSILL